MTTQSAFLTKTNDVLIFPSRADAATRRKLAKVGFAFARGQWRAPLTGSTAESATAMRDLLHEEGFQMTPQLVQQLYDLTIGEA